MIEITKEEMEFLISNNFLKCYKGKYTDLIIVGKNKKARRKKRYTTEPIAKNLKYMR